MEPYFIATLTKLFHIKASNKKLYYIISTIKGINLLILQFVSFFSLLEIIELTFFKLHSIYSDL